MPDITSIILKHMRLAAAAIAAAAAMTGCVSEEFAEPQPAPPTDGTGCINVTLRSSRPRARATEADVASLNEDLIASATVCLYPNDNPSGRPAFVQHFPAVAANALTTLSISLTNEMRDRLFPGGATTCSAYVAANLPASSDEITADMTLNEIRAISVTAGFASMEPQPSFVMDGSTSAIALLNAGTANEKASGNIELRRAASKINLAINIADNVTTSAGETWEPDKERMTVLITNGVQSSTLSPALHIPTDGDYYRTSASAADPTHRQRPTGTAGATSADFPYVLQNPFYTYPNRWNPNDIDARMTYMTLMVPWRLRSATGTAEYRTCYYTVPVTRGNEIGRNISYRVNINVDILGSFTPDDPFVLYPLSYHAVEWGEATTDVDIADFRYLVVDQNEYAMNNEASITIPVYTSHTTAVTDVKMTYYRYNTTSRGSEKAITIDYPTYNNTKDKGYGAIYTCEFHNAVANKPDDQGNRLEFNHPMVVWEPYNSSAEQIRFTTVESNGDVTFEYNTDNDVNKAIESIDYYRKSDPETAAYSRYETSITIAHTDNPAFTQTIKIVQYPQMYITASQNYYAAEGATAAQGRMWVNNNQSNDNGLLSSNWYNAYGLAAQGDNNANPNQYVIHITQLSQSSDPNKNYIIGDPRIDSPTNLYGWKVPVLGGIFSQNFNEAGSAPRTNWAEAPDMGGTKRRLQNYYPTDQSAAKARWIAPAIRVASSYGVCPAGNSYDEDKARCASYQELNRPAGRWRIPTVAEIEFIMKLSQDGKIPRLFNYGTHYMSAQGLIATDDIKDYGYIRTPDNTNDNGAVRCVYDEWYWGNDTITANEFTWGDRSR